MTELNKLSSSDFLVGAERALDPELVEELRGVEGAHGRGRGAQRRDGADQLNQPIVISTTDLTELGQVAG